jgi:hypothetical protein
LDSRQLEQLRKLEPLSGAARFMDRILYMRPAQRDACVLYYGATHVVNQLNTFGRLLVTSSEGNCGKTTVLDSAKMMCQEPWMTEPTKWALQGKFRGGDLPTVLLDEAHMVFGLNGQRGRSNPIYRPVVEGYRKSATFSGQIDGAPQDFSCFCPTVLAGQKKAVPPDLRTRCITIVMTPAPETLDLEDSLDEGVEADGKRIGEQMHVWAQMFADEANGWAREARRLHPKLRGRRLQIWGALYVVAKAAGPEWEERFLAAFKEIALDSSDRPILAPDQQVLKDAGEYLRGRTDDEAEYPQYLFSAQLLKHVRTLEDRIYTTKTDPQIGRLMSAGLGGASVLTLPNRKTVRGWHADAILALVAELEALLEPEGQSEEVDEFEDFFDEVYEGEFDEEQTTETTETTVPSSVLARRSAA